MKIIIFGHNGWIGKMMCDIIEDEKIKESINEKSNYNQIVLIKPDIRVNEQKEVEELIKKEKPTHIMSFIGRTHGKIDDKEYTTIDYLEQKGKLCENIRDNLYSPLILAILCKKYNIHFTYLGTGCIYTYDKNHLLGDENTGFTENDSPNFVGSGYSTVKGYTDQLMSLFDDTVLNLRIRMPITSRNEPRNFITKIITYEKICSIPNSMTVLEELLPYAFDMCKKKVTGTYNFTNPGVISHNEILELYKKIVDNSFKWKNFTVEEQRLILDSERSNNCLDTNKIEVLYPEIQHIRKSVINTLGKWKYTEKT